MLKGELLTTTQHITNNKDKTVFNLFIYWSANRNNNSLTNLIIYSCCNSCWEITKPYISSILFKVLCSWPYMVQTISWGGQNLGEFCWSTMVFYV